MFCAGVGFLLIAFFVFLSRSFDVELPVECDDEYWEDAEGNAVFKQPPGKPSKNSFFRYFLRLKQIHMFALRTVVSSFAFEVAQFVVTFRFQYAINRTKVALGRAGPQWEQDIVSEIDSALNAWVDAVPEHCKLFSWYFTSI